ncbi:hypothetical protein AAFF_G00123160 [Aldrovandia affinis]|uniref:Growth arrest-specific protein 7 n=1 Tax=Aldrovandia affinis TaxID=143900 RepID=A0AAD7RRX2_9TELE|nr:hypothetical protein AAFF_G00123160 [Aldrovandia affinis]
MKPASSRTSVGEEIESVPLPQGWKCFMSPHGRRYYVNTSSNETTWVCPGAPGTGKSPLKPKSYGVNGHHPSGSPLLQQDQPQVALRKAGADRERPVSTSPSRRPDKDTKTTINSITFPLPCTMPEQPLLKPGDWSYCDYFWADKRDPQGGACISGFEVLLQKQLKGKQMQKEMAEFVRSLKPCFSTGSLCSRIKIEEEYAKNLSKLSQIPLAAQEEGTLREAWAQLKRSLADEADVHLKFSSKLHSEVERPLLTFREHFKKDMKKYDHHIADLRKQLAGRYSAVEKSRRALADRQKDLEVKTQQLEIRLSNKTEEDIKKARRKSPGTEVTTHKPSEFVPTTLPPPSGADSQMLLPIGANSGDDLMRCVDLYNQAQSKWFEEMVTTSLELERLEVERVEMIRQHLRQYTTLRHETDMFNQSTVEPIDQLLQTVDPAKDREVWVMENKTGEIRPVDMDI